MASCERSSAPAGINAILIGIMAGGKFQAVCISAPTGVNAILVGIMAGGNSKDA